MSPASLVRRAAAAGVLLRVIDERLVLSAVNQPEEGLLREIRFEKTAIVAYLLGPAAWTEDDWHALYEERAGIMEFDGGLSRVEAESRAVEEVKQLRSLGAGDG